MTLVGAIGMLYMVATKHSVEIFNGNLCCKCGGPGWGGVSFGPFFFVSTTSTDTMKKHEWGHSIQNAVYGPAFLFIVALPSFIRYHYRN